MLLDLLTRPGAGRHVEQFSWRWRGPLNPVRFTAAWQSVADRETVLRAAFDLGPEPRLVFHDRVRAEVVRHRAGSVDWEELLERDRLRGFDLRRPGPLRITLVDEPVHVAGALPDCPAGGSGPVTATRVLLTFHHALLDSWSVWVLLEEFCRAYLTDGVLPGGERRPDIRDWAHWLEAQDPAPARDFWTRDRPGGTVLLPAGPGPDTRESGCGRAERWLSPAEAGRLHRWAAARAVPDSSALYAVWALLLYRAAGVGGPATVCFGVTVPGRGIALDAVERLPGPLRNCLPMTVRVNPAHRVGQLLTALRDRALDMAGYEWVSCEQIREWTGRTGEGKLLDSLVALESVPRPSLVVRAGLDGAGVVFEPVAAGAGAGLVPVSLLGRSGDDGSLTLTVVHDRARISDAEADRLVDHCARLLRRLPAAGERAGVADVLAALDGEEPPRIARRPDPAHGPARSGSRSIGSRSGVDRNASGP
ncbi:condensation domain-containing protein [Dermacoccus nishinomiyaensis]|uniref:condensation domain-containing protein n=1 Tax=Dermacoccus nishinomiyaensis TaxID=1274 RepID=UPI0033A0BC32